MQRQQGKLKSTKFPIEMLKGSIQEEIKESKSTEPKDRDTNDNMSETYVNSAQKPVYEGKLFKD